MGWEILHDKDLGKAVFMCNTMDNSNSPVFYVDSDFDKDLFYKWWAKMNLQDPRQMKADYLTEQFRRWELFQSEPVIKVKFNRVKKTSLMFTATVDLWGDFSISWKDGLEEEEYDALEEIQESIRESIYQGVWCGSFEYHNDSVWSITAVKRESSASKGYVPLESALMFPKTVPNNDAVVEEAIEIINH